MHGTEVDVVVLEFKKPTLASEAVEVMDGIVFLYQKKKLFSL